MPLRHVLCVLVYALGVMIVSDIEPATADQADVVLSRLKQIHALVLDRGRVFSISEILGELDGLAPAVDASPSESVARGELAYVRSVVLARAGGAEQALGPGLEAVRIDGTTPFLTDRERSRHLYAIARQAEGLRRYDLAIDSYRKALPMLDADPEIDDDQRLGTRERLAFCLHEAKRYAEARAVNDEVLARGEALFGPESAKLITVITNLSQNAYELGDHAAARRLLERRLALATRHDDEEHVDGSLFQLGVLAFEQGRPQEAEAFMVKRLALAEASGDAERITAARRDLAILHQKLGAR